MGAGEGYDPQSIAQGKTKEELLTYLDANT